MRGEDLTDLIGEVGFGDLVFFGALARRPDEAESRIFNAVLVSLAEYGLSASAIATRLTLRGAPGAVQGAIAAGILGVGDRFVGAVEESAQLLQSLVGSSLEGETLGGAIDDFLVSIMQDKGARIPGLGHPEFKKEDPRSRKLAIVARSSGRECVHLDALEMVRERFAQTGGRLLPLNVDGTVGALLSDLGFPWRGCRGVAVVARAGGLLGHVVEEFRQEASGTILRASQEAVPYRRAT